MERSPGVDGPARGLSRPPLPHGRTPKRSLKQREREVPDVDWERSLQHFAAAVSDDLDELHIRFLQENVVAFTTWKRLWADARMSAAFHVEFWESSPTKTHKTILQQALDALVCTIQEHNGEFDNEADVAALIGRVFALYCAYMVQLGTPRHQIDVDPQAWTALLAINCVMCGVGATMFPTATREVRAMMHRLAVEEKAFLRCLQGFGPSVRVRKRPVVLAGEDGAAQDLSVVADISTAGDTLIMQSTVEQLKPLNDRYQELMARARSAGPSISGVGARLGVRRGKSAAPAPLLSGSVLQEGNDGQDLARALTSYMEHKANEDARRNDRVARAAAARENERRGMLEQTSKDRDDRSNIMDLSDRGSVKSVPASPTTRSVAFIGHGPTRRRNSGISDTFMAELESELHADIFSDQVATTTARVHQSKHSSGISEISEADSDALAVLERELEQSVDVIAAPTRQEEDSAKVSTPARQKRSRPAGVISKRVCQLERSTTLVSRKPPIKHRDKQSSIFSEISEADSDALADLERELQQNVEIVPSRTRKAVPEKASSPTRRNRDREPPTTGTISRTSHRTVASAPKRARTIGIDSVRSTTKRLRSESVASRLSFTDSWAAPSVADSDGLDEIQAELDAIPTLAGPLETAPGPLPSDVNAQQCRKSSLRVSAAKPKAKGKAKQSARQSQARQGAHRRRDTGGSETFIAELASELHADIFSDQVATTTAQVHRNRHYSGISEISEADSNALADLERVPEQSVDVISAPSLKATVKAVASRSPLVRSKVPKCPAAPAPISLRRSARLSSLASDTESDGLEDLMAELKSTPIRARGEKRKQNQVEVGPKATPRAARRTHTQKKRPSSPKVVASRSPLVRSKVLSRPVASATIGLRRSARLSSLASETESDGLEDLMAELESTPVSKPPVKKKQKQRQSQEGPKATRTPRLQRSTTQKKRAQKIAAKPSTRQSPAAQVHPPSARRSTRSSSIALDSDSDGLAELEAELQAGPS